MNLHMKEAKYVKMNRTSFVSQHFFKGLQQIGETKMLSRVNFGRKMYLIPLSITNSLIFNFEKKSLVFNFYTKCKLISNTMLSLKLTKYLKVCYFYCPQKSICFIYPVFFFSFIDLN